MAEPASQLEQHLHLLVCPVCHGALGLEQVTIVCAGCGRRYPVVDGLPVLIESRGALDFVAGLKSRPFKAQS